MFSIKKSLPILFVGLFSTWTISGQKVVKDIIKAVDPNVTSFNKYLEHPVNLYSGSVDISIPVYTIKDGGFGANQIKKVNKHWLNIVPPTDM